MHALQALQRRPGTIATVARPPGTACVPPGSRARAGRMCCRASSTNSSADGATKRLMLLPDGNWFLETTSDEANVYGTSWVMRGHSRSQRRHASFARQAHGLVPLRSRPPTGVALRQPPGPAGIVPLAVEDVEVAIVVLPANPDPSTSTSLVPFQTMLLESDSSSSSGAAVDAEEAGGSSSLAIVPRGGSTMLGVVVGSALRQRGDDIGLPVNDESVYETFNTKHPRRTMKIKFTCKRCGATSIKPVNPHAWKSGSVFARCGKCNVTHKLIDNLKIFHELSGSVFPAPIQPRRDSDGDGDGPAAAAAAAAASDANDNGNRNDGPDPLQYDEYGFPLLPPRLRLRLRDWPFSDGASDTSRFN